jgi:riboflavin kinase / FMN adenylyltransferase
VSLSETLARAGIAGPSVVAVGTFDGVHLGHQRLVRELAADARRLGGQAVVLTFHPRPIEVLRPGTPSFYLCSLERRKALLRASGADAVVVIEFTRELSQTSAADFVTALVQHLGMRELVGGPDLALGHKRQGTPEVLGAIGKRLGFDVRIVGGLEIGDEVVRTTTIQRLVSEGELDRASRLLGRRHSVEGTVGPGAGRGRTIGIPTANVAVPERMVLPANGVYAVFFHVGGQRYGGAANLGVRPTFAGEGRSLEVHLLDFTGDLYGQLAEVEFVARLRPEQRFPGVEALVAQISEDIRRSRDILEPEPESP